MYASWTMNFSSSVSCWISLRVSSAANPTCESSQISANIDALGQHVVGLAEFQMANPIYTDPDTSAQLFVRLPDPFIVASFT